MIIVLRRIHSLIKWQAWPCTCHIVFWGNLADNKMTMFSYTALLLLLGLWSTAQAATSSCNGASPQANQILANVLGQLGITNINGACVPLYRLDLPANYIAYYEVHHSNGYLVVSAGEKTCDRDLVIDSNGTSPSEACDATAANASASCDKYYLLSDAGEMVCKDSSGKAVGHSFPKNIYQKLIKKHGDLDTFLKKRAKHIKKEFEKRCKTLKKAAEGKGPEGKSGVPVNLVGILPGGESVIILSSGVDKINIVYLSENSSDNGAAGLIEVCGNIEGCSVVDGAGVISSSSILPDPLRFVLKVSEEAGDAIFAVEITYSNGEKESRYFQIMMSPPSKRGWYQYSYSSFSYCWAYRHWNYPRWCPYWYNGCYVGGGALAWGHVFGLYDRNGYCQCLYRSGWNGLSGLCSQYAPYSRDWRVIYYLQYLRAVLHSQCPYGGTYASSMVNVRSFYWSRCYRSIYYYTSNLNYVVYYWVCQGRPVVVLFRSSSGSYEFPVVIGVRRRVIYRRYCYRFLGIWLRCGSWYSYYDYDYYLRFNWCNSKDGWYNMNNYRAYVAY